MPSVSIFKGFLLKWGFPIILLLLIAKIIQIYNNLIQLKNQVQNAWSQIDVQLKRRHDLIPNLVESVKGYAEHEKSTFERVIQARQQAVDLKNASAEAVSKAENQLSGALKSIFALSENYPELKANENFMALQEELSTTENRIGFARQFYNDSVMQLNQAIQMFPNNIIAGFFNFKEFTYFEVDAAEKEPVKVTF